MNSEYVNIIVRETGLKEHQVENTLKLLENGATMKTIVPSVSDGRHGLAFIFEKNEIIDECMKRWETEKDTYRNPM